MTITRLGTERRRMSKIVIHNDTVYLCGQVTKDANTGIKEQTCQPIGAEFSNSEVNAAGIMCEKRSLLMWIDEEKKFCQLGIFHSA